MRALLTWTGSLALLLGVVSIADAGERKIRVVIIDGWNNHQWPLTTPIMKKALEESGRFTVDVSTTPKRNQENLIPPSWASIPFPPDITSTIADTAKPAPSTASTFIVPGRRKLFPRLPTLLPRRDTIVQVPGAPATPAPDLLKYDVVLSNYNGPDWPKEFSDALDAQLKAGKIGLVIVHAANNAFGNWKEYNQMIGMGWRNNKFGDRLITDEAGKEVRIPAGQGDGSGHRYTGPFSVVVRDATHPITNGMPREWLHNNDELYDNMRGPIENVHLLATAYSKGTKAHEPMIWTVSYGKGRVFHTPMGHDANAMRCVGFQATLLRGAEWAATGNVTQPIPSNFPTADKVSVLPKAK